MIFLEESSWYVIIFVPRLRLATESEADALFYFSFSTVIDIKIKIRIQIETVEIYSFSKVSAINSMALTSGANQ